MAFQLVCYLNFGYPTIADGVRDVGRYYGCGCRAIQLDIPSRDPYLEHQMVKDRMAYCLEHTPNYDDYFNGFSEIRRLYPDLDITFMLYENIVTELGVPYLAEQCKRNGLINTGYVGNDLAVRRELQDVGLRLSSYIQFHLPDDEIASALDSGGRVALQVKSVGQTRPGCETFADGVKYLRARGITAPIFGSVGVKTPDDVRMIKAAGADGAFIGSVLMNVIDDAPLLEQTLREYMLAANE